ncbi:MAG: alcohol dehydrogenase [Lautropia sp.]|nr:MAG: alcohol dehydrogenase [Pseudomonadota bacterium]MBC6961058.1 alcohol dehydrogenase [Lautropia sp.]MCL4701241.1 zinc-dependent alcohol dehydrogenase family protein [Burkholderiaceae bacterium]MDL1906227.1 zinc-binding dehydrogenase [Betaproteobacteria bacterium PRO1]RIK85398.1 MAG: alcohol dehydrogenase [Burkholderiales bacterium]
MTRTMRAAVLRETGLPAPYAQSRPLSIEEVALEPPGRGEITVKIRAAGVCHSDLSAINGDRPWPMPIVVGHEAAAEVIELGAGVDDLALGDHVALIFRPNCGTCPSCATGRPALCEPGGASNASGSLLGGYRRLRSVVAPGIDGRPGSPLHHHLGCAAFAEYATVSRRSAVRIDPALPWDEAALFGCAVITGAGAVFNTARAEAGSKVAVVGLGGVGFSSLLAARAIGAREIVAIDMLESKLAKARALGATQCFDAADPELIAKVKEATGGGVDYAFEMAGSVAALELAYRITARGGTTVTAGLPNPQAQWPLQAVSLIAEERTIKGSYLGSCVPSRDIARFIAMYRRGVLPVNELLSERITLDEINPALDRLARGESIRQVIVMS